MDYIDQVQQLNFTSQNPFDIKEFVFENIKNALTTPEFEQLKSDVYINYFKRLELNEYIAKIVYGIASLDQHLNFQQQEFFSTTAQDEEVHGKMITTIINKITGECNTYNTEYFKSYFDNQNIDNRLNLYLRLPGFLINESAVVSQFAMFYKMCNDPVKKNLLKNFVAEETVHVSNILKILESLLSAIKNTRERVEIYSHFIDNARTIRYFIIDNIKDLLKNKTNINYLLDLAYHSDWAVGYAELFLKRTYPVCRLLNPTVSFDKYCELTKINFA